MWSCLIQCVFILCILLLYLQLLAFSLWTQAWCLFISHEYANIVNNTSVIPDYIWLSMCLMKITTLLEINNGCISFAVVQALIRKAALPGFVLVSHKQLAISAPNCAHLFSISVQFEVDFSFNNGDSLTTFKHIGCEWCQNDEYQLTADDDVSDINFLNINC